MSNHRVDASDKTNLWHYGDDNWIKVTKRPIQDIDKFCKQNKEQSLGGVLLGTYARKKFITVKRAFIDENIKECERDYVLEPVGYWAFRPELPTLYDEEIKSLGIAAYEELIKNPIYLIFGPKNNRNRRLYKVWQFDSNFKYGEYRVCQKQ